MNDDKINYQLLANPYHLKLSKKNNNLDDNIFLVTSYNCEAYITHCIESILNQTSKNYNVLFIDDCSTDQTVKRIKEYQSVLRNSRLFIGKKRTMSAAWNQAQVVKNVVKNPNSITHIEIPTIYNNSNSSIRIINDTLKFIKFVIKYLIIRK